MIQPLGDNVAIKRDTAPDRTPGGLHLPVSAQNQPLFGVVIAVGPGMQASVLSPGDRVAYGAHDTGVQEFDGVLITHAKYVFGRIEV